MVDVTVIIPVWNTEDYLERCLDSVQGQSLQSWELICVDDESSDGSAEIVRQRSFFDSRIRLLEQAHQGPGAARNRGIDLALGEFLYFLDSDDWIVPDALERLVTQAREANADLLFFETLNGERVSRAGRRIQRLRTRLGERVVAGADYLEPALQARAFAFSPCLQFSRRSLVTGNSVQFPQHDMAEDSVFTIRLTLLAERVTYRPDQLFYRRLRPGSLTTAGNPIKAIRGALSSWLAIQPWLADYSANTSTHRALKVFTRRHWQHALSQWDKLPKDIRGSLTWQNILESNEELSQRFLAEARRGSRVRAVLRSLRRRKPLVIEPLPPPKNTSGSAN